MVSTRDVIIRTNRLESAKAFYQNVMGFELFEQTERLLGFETGSFRLFVEAGSAHGAVFDFVVDDISDAKMQLVEHGCSVEEENPSVPRLYLRDPFGLVFNITDGDGLD